LQVCSVAQALRVRLSPSELGGPSDAFRDADLICQLSDRQIEELFKASRAAAMPRYHNHDGSFKSGVSEASVSRQWVEAFKQKREDLAKGRCEWKEKPADLTAIDNPMGLATVPNFCTAKPY
jgi:hypothetical protein